MTATILLQNEFYSRTSPSVIEPYRRESLGFAQTETVASLVLQFDLSIKHEKPPTGSITIDELVKQSEINPKRQRALEEGRRWVAETFYANEDDTLRVLRLRRGMSQAQIATAIGTTQPHVARIESGRCDVQVGTLTRLAEALGVRPLVVFNAFLKKRAIATIIDTHE